MAPKLDIGDKVVFEADGLDALLAALRRRGYQVMGPTVRDGAIVYDSIAAAKDLPQGWTERQEAARYRLERRDDEAFFGFAVGPQSWKKFLHPPVETLWRARRGDDGFTVEEPAPEPPRFAFLGVRACELQAIAIQDRVLLGDAFADAGYRHRRESAFLIAVNCGTAGGTCFCVSMGSGPEASSGFDIALTELMAAGGHRFLAEVGTALGGELLAGLTHRRAAIEDEKAAEAVIARTRASMGREMPADGVKELLQRNLEHARWDDVAARCLSCGNCTMVCPTCFCTTVEDVTALDAASTERQRKWDSCFTMDFSYIRGGSVRGSGKSRYRQWMTHKLASWHDQFGSSGCVGCGRCITWCPVGIDITEEVRAIRQSEGA
jgi:sulfhydrogenase subunit beta (sulfur reductase)